MNRHSCHLSLLLVLPAAILVGCDDGNAGNDNGPTQEQREQEAVAKVRKDFAERNTDADKKVRLLVEQTITSAAGKFKAEMIAGVWQNERGHVTHFKSDGTWTELWQDTNFAKCHYGTWLMDGSDALVMRYEHTLIINDEDGKRIGRYGAPAASDVAGWRFDIVRLSDTELVTKDEFDSHKYRLIARPEKPAQKVLAPKLTPALSKSVRESITADLSGGAHGKETAKEPAAATGSLKELTRQAFIDAMKANGVPAADAELAWQQKADAMKKDAVASLIEKGMTESGAERAWEHGLERRASGPEITWNDGEPGRSFSRRAVIDEHQRYGFTQKAAETLWRSKEADIKSRFITELLDNHGLTHQQAEDIWTQGFPKE